MLIAVSYGRCGRNLQGQLYTVINSLSANHAYLKRRRKSMQKLVIMFMCQPRSKTSVFVSQ